MREDHVLRGALHGEHGRRDDVDSVVVEKDALTKIRDVGEIDFTAVVAEGETAAHHQIRHTMLIEPSAGAAIPDSHAGSAPHVILGVSCHEYPVDSSFRSLVAHVDPHHALFYSNQCATPLVFSMITAEA